MQITDRNLSLREKKGLRKKMIEACIEKQQLLIDDFKNRIHALLETEGLGNEEEYDNQHQARIAQNAMEINFVNQALEFANREMTVLQFISTFLDAIHVQPELGAVVVTDQASFFVSTSIEQFEVDGRSYIGLSTHSPLYLAMSGKKKGDIFFHHSTVYSIQDVF